MKRMTLALACALALSACTSTGTGTDYGCDAVNFSAEVLEKMPNAKRLCRGLTEKNDGVYVKYVAKVVSSSPEAMTVDFLDKDDKAVSRVTFSPKADQTVTMDNKKVQYREAEPGTELDFYINASRWGLFSDPGAPLMEVTKVEHL